MSSKHQANYNEQDPFAAMERKGIVTPDTLPDVIKQGREMMARHNEQTLRPASDVTKDIWAIGMKVAMGGDIRQKEITEVLTTDRDAAYTMLRELVKGKAVTPWDYYHDQPGTETMVKLDDILTLLDTIYGKTHTV